MSCIHAPACREGAGGTAGYSHLQDHDDVGLFFEGVHTLDQFGVVEAVHDADLLPDALFLFCRICFEEFPCPDFSSFLFYESKDLSELPTASERRREKAHLAKLPTHWEMAHKSGPPVFIKFYWSTVMPFACILSVGDPTWLPHCPTRTRMCREVVATQTAWPAKPGTSITWPFTERVCQPCSGSGKCISNTANYSPHHLPAAACAGPTSHPTCQPCCSFSRSPPWWGLQCGWWISLPFPPEGLRLRKSPQTQRMPEWLPPFPLPQHCPGDSPEALLPTVGQGVVL